MSRSKPPKAREGRMFRSIGGRPQAVLTPELREEFLALLERCEESHETGKRIAGWREHAPRLAAAGLALLKLSDAREIGRNQDPLLARAETAQQRAFHESLRGDLQSKSGVELRDLGIAWSKAADEAQRMIKRDDDNLRRLRRGDRGPLPNPGLHMIVRWIDHRGAPVVAVARLIAELCERPNDWPHVERTLRKALATYRTSDGE